MKKLEDLLQMWSEDANIDQTEPGRALLQIPKLHSKYLHILSNHRMIVRDYDFKLKRMKKIKWEYYTGKLDQDTLSKYGWEPFPFVLKSEISTYLESDEDINRIMAQKELSQEIVDVCLNILKELNNRTWELKSFIDYEKFINGS
jgi:hypothetical protein